MDNKDTLVLTDGTEIKIEEDAIGMNALCVHVQTKGEADALWEKLTPENLKEVQIIDTDGTATGRYKDMILDHLTGRDEKDGTVKLTLCIREKTYEEKLEERITQHEADQNTHTEAISDQGQAVSQIAESG